MIINIGKHDCTEVWDNVFYKSLSNYPNVTDNEMKDIIDFIEYEDRYGRNTDIVSENSDIYSYVTEELKHRDKYRLVKRPEKITECTACPIRKGCMTDFICHTAPLENAKSILKSGSLLSALKVRKVPVEELMKEDRNAANDPADFFHYVMFSWGNCQAGDRLVMERKLKRNPTDEDMSTLLTPGIRFYFKYEVLNNHPSAVHDGFLPIKVEDEVVLKDYVYAIVIPRQYRDELTQLISKDLIDRTYFIEYDCRDVWEWSEKVYSFVRNLSKIK